MRISLFFYPLSALAAAYLVTCDLEDLPDVLLASPVCWYLVSAAPAQVAIESLAAAVAVPVILGHGPLHPSSVALFCTLAAAIHTYGYLSNRTDRPGIRRGPSRHQNF